MNRLIIASLFLVTFIACDTTSTNKSGTGKINEEAQNGLVGTWGLIKAQRGNNDADLPGIFMIFTEEGMMESNIQTGPAEQPFSTAVEYTVEGEVIATDVTGHEFEIKTLNDTTLILKTELMSFDFTFEFKREHTGSESEVQ